MRNAVLVSLDALCEQDLSRLPADSFLARMPERGAACTAVKTVFPALTYPAHATLITGCDPDRTGIGHNQPLQPGVASASRAWYWDRRALRVPTLFDAVRQAGGKSAAILWPVTGKDPAIRWRFPEVRALPGENQVLKMLAYGSPLFVLLSELRYGRLRRGIAEPELSDYAAAITGDVIRRHRPQLTAVHLIDLDETRHLTGAFSPQSEEALLRLSRRLEAIDARIRRTRGMEDALLIAVSDHGQSDVSRTVCLNEELRRLCPHTGLLAQSCGLTAYFYLRQGSRETALTEMTLLRTQAEKLGIARFYPREELDRLHAVPEPLFAVEAAPGVQFADLPGEGEGEKATHGFGPGHPAENCLFAVLGPGIRPGARIPKMPMRDVAPTIAGLMGLALPSAAGTSHARELVQETGRFSK